MPPLFASPFGRTFGPALAQHTAAPTKSGPKTDQSKRAVVGGASRGKKTAGVSALTRTSKPVSAGQDQIGRQLLNLSASGRFTPERVLKLLSGVPALKKFPVATSRLAASPGLGERILRLVTTRAKRGELVSEKDFMSLLVSQARSGLRR